MFDKSKIKAYFETLQLERIQSIQDAMSLLRNDLHSESKSSAGDKYETGRAMIHLEMEKLQSSLSEYQQQLSEVRRLTTSPADEVGFGSIVVTKEMIFYISISLGKINTTWGEFICLSPSAPLAKQLKGKRKNDTAIFNAKTISLIEVL
jgi:hypothetical protein